VERLTNGSHRGRLTAATLCVALLSGCGGAAATAEPGAGPTADAAAPTTNPSTTLAPSGSAAALLAALAVKGRAPMTGYRRDQFGQAWADVNRNGCDTRNDVLRRDLTEINVRPGTHDCVVDAGLRADPYTGQDLHFVRGGSVGVDIDHVVALGDAWATGAQYWPVAERIALANDPGNLLAVDASANRQKGDSDAASWLPPQKSYRCAYVARQVAVKAKYRMWVTAAEHDAIARVLQTCPGEPAPVVGVMTPAPAGLGVVPSVSASPRPSAPAGTDPRFATCAEAKTQGYGPYGSTDPEYSWYRDADHDGTVCEG
jgi:hypothetical protein